MVGIVLASHGGFADGIFQSAEMIFGKQENLAHVILKPDEGPDDIRAKMEKAVASFDDQDQVLFLIDLWGGTPFNQANNLVKEHEDTWAIVSGMNLPMVIEALGQRMASDNAHDIAKAIVEPGRDGIKTQPESLMPKEETKAAPSNNAQPQGAIPEGTVIGDGHIKYVLARIDSRLLHGQVATGWTKAMNPNRIIVVSDNVAKDKIRKTMIKEAAPAGVPANVVPINKMLEVVKDPRFGNTKALILFENPEDALKAIEGGMDIKELNVGSMAYSDGKVNVNTVLAMDQKDIDTYKKLKDLGVKFDVRKVPSDGKQNMDELLDKAQKLVDEKK
ncbi:PTS mannose transporter subunit IIAB [Lactobacillus johnsonii]|uniref:PTS system mannose-specific EIIAB component n=1 Tax=Lactobacillus johnsonii TaxID=33959 RepID=A0AAX0PX72_LACJH|nr:MULTISPECIES: PTS sugar transporter subunit IIB [Lactobacillus]ARW74309.1 PTS mannose transporter subunit IIAB [Lactobacillus johnsonii]ARW76108.1 PTS mannose transporter subunit IIAB [Lactobacillus johnsonii]PAB42463.1 PTS mannose transporter subunit IIAB [Lactobacillus johnsonii]PAB53497.1 PTS mannose transporter subunit IIAB [Lactobacillus johnsonii]PAB56137.1 PTS mannose transporter subunit IIAB [Lactobacillus johnsonii]